MVKNRSSKARRVSSKANGGRRNPTLWMFISPDSCDENRQEDNNEPADSKPRICEARSPDPKGGVHKVRGDLGYVARDDYRLLRDKLLGITP